MKNYKNIKQFKRKEITGTDGNNETEILTGKPYKYRNELSNDKPPRYGI